MECRLMVWHADAGGRELRYQPDFPGRAGMLATYSRVQAVHVVI